MKWLIIIGFFCLLHAEDYRLTKPEAWQATTVEDAIAKLYGKKKMQSDSRVVIKAPNVASNGGAVPVQVETTIDAKSIAILQDVNPASLLVVYGVTPYSIPSYALKIRLASSGTIVVVVEGKDGNLYTNSQRVEVALGGCEDDSSYIVPSRKMSTRYKSKKSMMRIDINQESYAHIKTNRFKEVSLSPLSTFSTDVDTASYTNIRRYLFENKSLPPKDAVRTEEMVNYFSYDYQEPRGKKPFAISTRIGTTLWNKRSQILQIGIQAKKPNIETLPPSHLVFLLDVSGSMGRANKLPLLTKSLALLVKQLRKVDRVSIVVYAGSSGLVLDRAKGNEKHRIIEALERLKAGGSTAGGSGINLAYSVAEKGFIKGGNNRIILATDGDFNVGQKSEGDLSRLIEEKRKSGIYLSVLGFGTGNYKDNTMELLADKGNGNYAYIDSLLEAKKVLVTQMGGTLYTIAKDVKIQVEFNPSKVEKYRLIGYENRLLNNEDFKDDKIDAAEIGMGHRVTALYEVIMHEQNSSMTSPLKYQKSQVVPSDEIATVKIRYKLPDSNTSVEMGKVIREESTEINDDDYAFTQSVVGFGMMLQDSEYKKNLDYHTLIENAKEHKGNDSEGYRAEFIKMMESAELY